MIYNFKLVKVDTDYCDYLRKFDLKVPYNRNKKEIRPFVGVLFKIKKCEYFAPLTSPKKKHTNMHNNIDFFKIDNGTLGAINFNNMIPVDKENYKEIDLDKEYDTKEEVQYYKMLSKQVKWLNEHYNLIINKSFKLYTLYVNNKLPNNIKNRCCNFILLEEKCDEYNKNSVSV